ncbi:TPA: hypothetical protein ACVO3E_001949 [Vibrio diabolicus]
MKAILIVLALSSSSLIAKPISIEPFYSPYNNSDRFFVDKVNFLTQDDIRAVYDAEWYFEFPLKSASGEVSVAKSCADLEQKSQNKISAKIDSEHSALMATKVLCDSWKVMGALKPSNTSYIPDGIISESLPDISPSELSFIISDEQVRRSKEVHQWADMDKITSFERLNDFQAVFYDNSDGYQKVTLLATGDYNDDGLEDVILLKENSVLSGSYTSTHGYVLSKLQENGSYELIKEW